MKVAVRSLFVLLRYPFSCYSLLTMGADKGGYSGDTESPPEPAPVQGNSDLKIEGSSDLGMKFSAALKIAEKLPKTELHLHLDGSIPPELVVEAGKGKEGYPQTTGELRTLVDDMKAAFRAKGGFSSVKAGNNMNIFDWMNQFLQTKEELETATYELCRFLYVEQKVRLAEVRFCPKLHTLKGLTEEQAVEAVNSGVTRAEKEFPGTNDVAGFKGGVILCGLRTFKAPHQLDTAKLAKGFLEKEEPNRVVGYDIAGPETNFPLTQECITEALEYCTKNHVPMTLHAGEVPKMEHTMPNLLAILDEKSKLNVPRIGHGFATVYGDIGKDDSDHLLKLAKEKGVLFEVCTTSNVPFMIPSYKEHPVKKMHDAGCKIALSCDNLTLSGLPDNQKPYEKDSPYKGSFYAWPSGEVAHAMADCGFSPKDIKEVLMNGARGSFVAKDEAWLNKFEAEIDRVYKEEGIQID